MTELNECVLKTCGYNENGKCTQISVKLNKDGYCENNIGQLKEEELNKIASFDEAVKLYNDKKITVKEFIEITARYGKNLKLWDIEKEPNTNYPDNVENSRVGFKWSPFKHIKGIYYQAVIKKAMIAAINFVHEKTLSMYDKNQFVYDDIRLIELDTFTKAYIDMHFKDAPGYKDSFMNKLVDIVIGTISKEDIYYRAVLFDYINMIIKTYPKGFELTPQEKENIRHWHKMERK